MIDASLRRIIATESDQYQPYNRYGDPVPGMWWLPLSGELLNGEFECFLLRMDAGAVSRPHEHGGYEEFLVLQGELVDNDGRSFRAGDFVSFAPGSKHSSHSPGGCSLLVMLRGNSRALREDEIELLPGSGGQV